MNEKDTIAAIATGLVESGIGIIRISGSRAIEIADGVFGTREGKRLNLTEAESHTIHYGFIYDGLRTIDECLISIMRAPRSFTSEDTVEINCHGGPFILTKVLDIVIKNGARLAEPGEFTKRAFLNGRIDLSEAESVMDLISSRSEYSLDTSIRNLKGQVYEKVCMLRESILTETAYIEAVIDDPEHYSFESHIRDFSLFLETVSGDIETIIKDSENGAILKEGIKAVVIGKPNVGKSTLFNKLIGREAAIVTDLAGTTRDILETEVRFNGLLIRFFDTAGIHETSDRIEIIGVEKSRKVIQDADLVIFMMDKSSKIDKDDREILDYINGSDKKYFILLNKSDLSPVIGSSELESCLSVNNGQFLGFIDISAKRGENLDSILEKIHDYFMRGEISFNQEVILSNKRQIGEMKKAAESISNVKAAFESGLSEEFYSVDLMSAYESLGRIIGKSVEDDLADKIFADFCMGK
ncbi:MAG: tRNA uridine-5-carboxymethylaminomethyl(34) synthesis GTPase MnmE [Lachnospiraceae bacterium]|nr:tRNA uridine-5-carboxymethylaminomethyl(34) synthesis GTPase MnmE [Lachnospiraceae bacterium]